MIHVASLPTPRLRCSHLFAFLRAASVSSLVIGIVTTVYIYAPLIVNIWPDIFMVYTMYVHVRI